MDVLECIETRRSVRRYTDQRIDGQTVNSILEARVNAPSGKNGQPWKFKVVTDKNLISQISGLSIYGS